MNSEEVGAGFEVLYSSAASISSRSTLFCMTEHLNSKFKWKVATNVPNQFVLAENTTHPAHPQGYQNFVVCDGCSILVQLKTVHLELSA